MVTGAAGEERYDLMRFVAAQDDGGTYDQALAELRGGRKQTHWMWFVFPQIQGLGDSPTARLYAIDNLDEARAYLAHPVLGPRLREAAQALLQLPGSDPERVLGAIDAIKLQSSMTLFEAADPEEMLFAQVLDKYFAGRRDLNTLSRL